MQKMIFVHVLKTAGTTLIMALKRIYKKRLLNDKFYKKGSYDTKNIIRIDNQIYPPNYETYDAITGHYKWDKYDHLNWPLVTFLRNPVERMISLYYYLRLSYKKFGYGDLDIVQLSKLINNQASYVVGDLDKYAFIGITEQFDKSFKLMSEQFNLKPILNIENKRVSHLKEKVNKKTRRKIRDNILEDVKLYEEAVRRFENLK